ncbi:MAG: mechanosensitive ion channel [Candidatus Thermoplasmatota archaeon]|nr:mechanosensitive ion channel [Candidatus Thermoplasmatota archaeon]
MRTVAFEWLDDPVLGSIITVENLLIAGTIFAIGVVLAAFMPGILARNIARIFSNIEFKSILKGQKRNDEEKEKERGRIDRRMDITVARPIKRGLMGFYILLFLVLAIYTLPLELGTRFRFFGNSYEAWRFLQFGVSFFLILLLSLFALEPIMRASIYLLLGSKVSKKSKYVLYRSLRFSVKLFLVVFGTFISMELSFTDEQLHPLAWILKITIFVMILIAAYIIAQLVVTITEPQYRSGGRSKKDMGKAVSRGIKIGIYIAGALIGLLYLGISPTAIFGGSVVAGIVLGFGLQDTISNLAAGVLIVMDKPFVIGDRIRLDWGGIETWGDVTDISMRSTWIKTPEDEMIVIPNNVIASSQVWNYTRDSPRMALTVDIGISYDSDWRLAEKLILEILHKHPLVLNKPPPYVMMKDFAESAQMLTVKFWIPEARDRNVVKSDVLKRVKDAFDHCGVEIPFPYRTLVYKKEIPKPHKLAEEYKSSIFLPSTGFKKFKFQEDSIVEVETIGTSILAPTSGFYTAQYTAPFVMQTAKKVGASVTALYIHTPGSTDYEGQRALRIYNELAKSYGIDIKLIYKEGDVLENILEVAEQEEISLIIMGSTEESIFGRITRRSISQELLIHLSIPTMVVPIKAAVRMKEEIERKKKAEAREFDDEAVDFTSLGALEKMEEESMDHDEE